MIRSILARLARRNQKRSSHRHLDYLVIGKLMTDKCYSELFVCVRVVGVYNHVQCITSQITGQGGSF